MSNDEIDWDAYKKNRKFKHRQQGMSEEDAEIRAILDVRDEKERLEQQRDPADRPRRR